MIIKTKFDGLILVKNKKFNDSRGYFKELIVEKKGACIAGCCG